MRSREYISVEISVEIGCSSKGASHGGLVRSLGAEKHPKLGGVVEGGEAGCVRVLREDKHS